MAADSPSSLPEAVQLTALTETQRDVAIGRFGLLRPFLENGVPLSRIADSSSIPLRRLQRWVRGYRQYGLAGLVRRRRSDRGQHGRVNPDLKRLTEGLALGRPPPSAASVHRRITQIATERGWSPPSYSSVCSIIRDLDRGLVVLAHDGSKSYREQFDLLYRREASRPNEIWQADHTPLDIWLRDDSNEPRRPWLTCIIDDYSRAVSSYVIGFQAPSSLVTSLALRRAIWRKEDPKWPVCGIPDIFYSDHGSDFTSRHQEQVSVDLKFDLVFSTPGMPRGRGRIERLFETINQLFLCELPGYTPPGSRPAKPQITIADLLARFHPFLVDDYHRRPHSETGEAPISRWEAGGFLPRLPESLEQLDLLLMTVAKSRRVRRDGIRFQGFRYVELTLAAYVGQDVTIRYDPQDLAEVRVFHRNCFLCRAVCQELAGETIALRDIIRARNRRRRELRNELKEKRDIVDQYLSVHDVKSTPTQTSSEPPSSQPRLKRYYND